MTCMGFIVAACMGYSDSLHGVGHISNRLHGMYRDELHGIYRDDLHGVDGFRDGLHGGSIVAGCMVCKIIDCFLTYRHEKPDRNRENCSKVMRVGFRNCGRLEEGILEDRRSEEE
ncbi:hypothetical protein L6452_38660 [Arctium lappa]|uniref:Uncharacterized protein n=1 Tax=Arctium lappa TaxID=4217 RepID=A0ACB8XQD9_ARCLA|nr:hypothetical protein L6452_38660 [Arctium lappa]